MSEDTKIYDVVVVGGGMVGLIFAQLLDGGLRATGAERSILLLETDPPVAPDPNADIDLRVSALSPASRAILATADVWTQLAADRVSPYERMCVWQAAGNAGGEKSLTFDAAECAAAALGYIVENRAVRVATWKQLADTGSVTMLSGRKAVGLRTEPDCNSLELDDGSTVQARLLVGADSSRSWVREQLGVAFRQRLYGQSAVVAHIATEHPHANTAWQRFAVDGPVALLPLADGRVSLVWSCPDSQAAELCALENEHFESRLAAAVDHVLGEVECVSQRVSFPLGAGHAASYSGRRFALIGDAAHRIHPLAGQGVNLGLLDAAELAEQLVQHLAAPYADAGDPLALRRYERARKGDNLVTLGSMDVINRLFTGSAAELSGAGLDLVKRMPQVKSWFAEYAMGRGRDLPAAARLTDL